MTPRVSSRSLWRKQRGCLRLAASFTPSLQPPQLPITPHLPLRGNGGNRRDQIQGQQGEKWKMRWERDRGISVKATRPPLSPAYCSTRSKILNTGQQSMYQTSLNQILIHIREIVLIFSIGVFRWNHSLSQSWGYVPGKPRG